MLGEVLGVIGGQRVNARPVKRGFSVFFAYSWNS